MRRRRIEDLASLSAADVMRSDLIMVSENESVASAWELLARGRFRHLPVLRQGHLVGVLDDQILVRTRTPGSVGATRQVIGDLLPRTFPTVLPDTGLAEVLQRLRAEGLDALPVVCDDGAFLGLVTADDVVELLADALVDERTAASAPARAASA